MFPAGRPSSQTPRAAFLRSCVLRLRESRMKGAVPHGTHMIVARKDDSTTPDLKGAARPELHTHRQQKKKKKKKKKFLWFSGCL
eukprot:NODE_7776_length_421_cov_299.516393.p2 GENE.NODE_7776_length_421_cov_299.516393~~NODE_7776_length_421_cov_299.516393.p2  ORF type:complete len:84 (-),score=23.57 NODE_7776_length_421_cov_299.516393:27-278(-)